MTCFTSDTIANALDLPPDDPRAKHVAECPRCSALLLSYQDFVSASVPEGVDVDGANARLSSFLDTHVRGTGGATAAKRSRLHKFLGVFAMRPAFAGVLIAVITVAVLWWRPWRGEEPSVLRGVTVSGDLELRAAEPVGDRSVRLAWSPREGADGYEVRFFAEDLTEVGRVGPVTTTSIVVDLDQVVPDGRPGSTLLWRVVAFANGDELDASHPGSFELP